LRSPYLGIQSMLTIFPGYYAVGHCAVHLYRHIVRFSLILRDPHTYEVWCIDGSLHFVPQG
jgi:hypothetical protein